MKIFGLYAPCPPGRFYPFCHTGSSLNESVILWNSSLAEKVTRIVQQNQLAMDLPIANIFIQSPNPEMHTESFSEGGYVPVVGTV